MLAMSKLLHIVAAIIWLGGMTFMLQALRPVVIAQLEPPVRLPLLASVLRRFFWAVWLSIAVLLASGLAMLLAAGMARAPLGQHLMLVIGMAMALVFTHLFFGPFRLLRQAVAEGNWTAGGTQVGRLHRGVVTNFVLGWLAVAAVVLIR